MTTVAPTTRLRSPKYVEQPDRGTVPYAFVHDYVTNEFFSPDVISISVRCPFCAAFHFHAWARSEEHGWRQPGYRVSDCADGQRGGYVIVLDQETWRKCFVAVRRTRGFRA